jgi:metal-dependent amidase/aminoacylase/carboxypeptidase family protein
MTLEELYKDLHAHPELAFAEHRTAGIAAEWLAGAGYTVTAGIGGTGVAGVLRNGDGPTVLVRADMDALPLREETGLDYASDVVAADARGERTHVMHACGHDMHVTCLCGAAAELAATAGTWRGTVIAVFQPAEEIAVNDDALTVTLAAALHQTREIDARMGSEDFGLFGTAAGVPSAFWGLGCAADGSPGNHSPQFAPQIEPTLSAGTNALVTAVRAVLPVV